MSGDDTERLAYETVECWGCGKQRYTYESCHHCGASCKPLTKRKSRANNTETGRSDTSTEGSR